jgi:hypothetical protein
VELSTAITQLEAVLEHQVALAGNDPAVAAAVESLTAALGPAVHRLAMELAEQAAAEVRAQLPDHEVEIVLVDGEPSLRVRPADLGEPVGPADAEARLTLRLPENLKHLIEEEADELGDSINSWVVKALSSRARSGRRGAPGTHVTGEFET